MEFPQSYDAKVSEKKWQQSWEESGIHRFDPESKAEVYSVDTPPPTVSGQMHMGHAFSYSQADFIVRYQRMRGKNIFYPFGFDDNGLATERFVEKRCNVRSVAMPRQEFVKLCLKETKDAEKELQNSWASLGISCDWTIAYRTISPECQKVSQKSFVELWNMGRAYQKEAPVIWCPECRTAIAQVEMEDKELDSQLVYIKFGLEDGGSIEIATSRPELMPACVMFSVHPSDERYKHLVGKRVLLPFFDRSVPVIADESVDMEFGTGAMYHCTFGDIDDYETIVLKHNLPITEVIGRDGIMNEKAGRYAGLKVKAARKQITEDLEKEGLVTKKVPIKHIVNVHERCGTDIELLTTKQWFIKVMDLRDEWLKLGQQLNWYPEHMRNRYDNWVKGLKWDWCISRQRFFGIPFPVWYCQQCGKVMVADESELPVDPLEKSPGRKCSCGSCEFTPEKDVLDTWATSSLSPQIALGWGSNDKFFNKLFPMTLRPQAHDIISFWLFHTVAKSWLHQGKLPWRDTMISGWALDAHGKKMSKSKGNTIDPLEMMAKYSADALRYWASSSKLGEDLWFSEKEFISGMKTVNKLWNAYKFTMIHLEGVPERPKQLATIDSWMLIRLNRLIETCTQAFDKYEYVQVRLETEKFFWQVLCDNYLEIVKTRLYNKEAPGRDSALYTLHQVMHAVLKLYAPLLPHITEELYQICFAEDAKSIHVSAWPVADTSVVEAHAEQAGELLLPLITILRKKKSERKVSLKEPIKKLCLECDDEKRGLLNLVETDLKSTMNVQLISYEPASEEIVPGLKITVEI